MDALICDAVRTPIGRYGQGLSSIRADDLAAIPIAALMSRNPSVDWNLLNDVILGCANQAGEDNRNIARMAALLAGMPPTVPGVTINRLCSSGMDAVGSAARGIKAGDYHMVIAGGVESMSRAPFVIPKASSAYARNSSIFDTTIGWRFINPRLAKQYGTDSMPKTAENVAEEFGISREDQDAFAFRSQQRWQVAKSQGVFDREITHVEVPQSKGEPIHVDRDEHPRPSTTPASLAGLATIQGSSGSVTAGNASGINDGAAALLLTNNSAARSFNLTPLVRVIGMRAGGVEPRIMGIGPVNASQKLLQSANLSIDQMDVIELNEAFASQALATLRQLGVADDDPRVNPNGGAIAMGHPLGMSGARLVLAAAYQLNRTKGRYALCTMCVGVGQGVALILERV
ncbi:MAG: 3-oxoadipyl-CoA thiolase [Aestuariivita sp.]|nr:3-oxoadipyl-CoA thiolase [Aestuariivita sp.]MCY4346680.1 3-oxoadipyl-CoA thiolase [Aestuariivita sp.]